MKFRIRFNIISHLMMLFMLLLILLLALAFTLIWFFRLDVIAHGTGVVKSSSWIDIKPEVKGIIRKMKVKEGQKVEKGNVLFILEDREREVEVEASLLKISKLRNSIAKLEKRLIMTEDEISGAIDEARASLAEAEANLRIAHKGPKPEEITLAKDVIERAGRYLEKTTREYERMKRAFSLKLVSQARLDGAFHDMRLAQMDLKLARGELELLRNRYDTDQVSAARANVDQKKAALSRALARENEISLLRDDLTTAFKALAKEEKQLAVLKEHLKLTRVTAPIDSYVLTHDTEHLEGKAVLEGEVVIRLGDTSEYIIDCKVPERDFPLVNVGQEARVTIKPFPKGEYKLFKARVLTVGADIQKQGSGSNLGMMYNMSGIVGQPMGKEEGYYPVILTLDRPYTMHLFGNLYEIRPGFSAEVEIIVEDERIATYLLRRVLRIKGKLSSNKIHL
jgi:multidrug resistance efflux pump